MKKFSFLALAAAGLLFAACSDKDEEVKAVQPSTEEFSDGAYIGISLQLPSADNAITRANDDLSNGTADEFAVKNATLYIFKAAKNEANPDENATYVGYVSLGTNYEKDKEGAIPEDKWGIQDGVAETNITSTYNEATQIPNILASEMKSDLDNDYYAYVIVNHNGQVPELTKDATTFKTFSNEKFSEIGADIAKEKNIWDSGLLMTSSPICDTKGGTAAAPTAAGNYTTLVKLDNAMIFGSKDEAEKNPAACVYVERAAVKITVEDHRSETTIGANEASILGWQVINYEPKYYNTRHIEAVWGDYVNEKATKNPYRFVSFYQFAPTLPVGTATSATAAQTHTTGFRTYFAKDVQYDANATLSKTVATDNDEDWIAINKHAYTTENTFDVQHQTWQNTTMVTLKVKIGDGTTPFYTIGKNSQTPVTTTDDVKATIHNIVLNDPTVLAKYNELLAKISENNPSSPTASITVTAGLKVEFTAPTEGKMGVAFTVTPDYKIKTGDAEPVSATYAGDGELTIKNALQTAIDKVIYVDPTASEKEFKDEVLLSCYVGGISYYNVRIKHFGDVETPWSATLSAELETATAGSGYIVGGGANVNEIYYGVGKDDTPTAAQKLLAEKRFLGRYGLVRDNWYKLSIDKIGKIGTAEPVDPSKTTPDTPDDEIENFISVHVHILPWVLREQSVNL